MSAARKTDGAEALSCWPGAGAVVRKAKRVSAEQIPAIIAPRRKRKRRMRVQKARPNGAR
jgi:hypothetical protein